MYSNVPMGLGRRIFSENVSRTIIINPLSPFSIMGDPGPLSLLSSTFNI